MAAFDLAIDGGTVITPEGRRGASVYITDGRIAAVGPDIHPAVVRHSAAGLLLMPGMVDAHVHLMEPREPEREDVPSGTAAAVRAGVTTVIEHTHSSPVRTLEDFEAKVRRVGPRSRIDLALAAHAWPGGADALEPLARAGVAFFKVFTCTTHGVPAHGQKDLEALFSALAQFDATALVHCEDEGMTRSAEAELHASGRLDGGILPIWRSREAELRAVEMVLDTARRTGARVVVAHASHPRVVELVQSARAAGVIAFAETCPQYLTLLEDEVLTRGPFRKFTPPARAHHGADLDDMWREIADGRISYVASDHAPSTAAQKLRGTIWDAPFGLPGLDTTLPRLLDAAHAGLITYERITEVYARTPARLYGLAPRKGSLEVGADGDVVLVDPNLRWTVRDEDVVSRAAWSPYSGRTFTGRAVATFVGGRLASATDVVLAEPGAGRILHAGPTSSAT